nr:uncharacterized protein LOC117681180 isoform X4 [Crassostrea gigas]
MCELWCTYELFSCWLFFLLFITQHDVKVSVIILEEERVAWIITWLEDLVKPVLWDTLVLIVLVHALIHYMDNFVSKNVTAANQNVTTLKVVKNMASKI